MMSHWIIAPVVLPAIMGAFALLVLRNSLPVARTLSTAATAWLEDLIRTQMLRGGSVVLTSHQGVTLDGTPHQFLSL